MMTYTGPTSWGQGPSLGSPQMSSMPGDGQRDQGARGQSCKDANDDLYWSHIVGPGAIIGIPPDVVHARRWAEGPGATIGIPRGLTNMYVQRDISQGIYGEPEPSRAVKTPWGQSLPHIWWERMSIGMHRLPLTAPLAYDGQRNKPPGGGLHEATDNDPSDDLCE